MAADQEAADHLRRRGLAALPPRTALAALGQALAVGDAACAVADVEWSAFGASFASVRPSPLIAGLPEVAALARPADADTAARGAAAIGRRLDGLSPAERRRALLHLVRGEVAGVIGLGSADDIEPTRAFRSLGFDSLTVLELRDRLTGATGLALPSTLLYDHPTAAALADHLDGELSGAAGGPALPLLAELDRLESALTAVSPDDLDTIAPDDAAQAKIARRIQDLLSLWNGARGVSDTGGITEQLDEASDDDLFDLIDRNFGRA
jgi:acyl carrier protein